MGEHRPGCQLGRRGGGSHPSSRRRLLPEGTLLAREGPHARWLHHRGGTGIVDHFYPGAWPTCTSALTGAMVRTFMSYQARRELLVRVAPRYQEARGRQRSHILDEFIAITGYAR